MKNIFSLLLLLVFLAPQVIKANAKNEGHTLGHYIVHTVVQGVGGATIAGAATLGTVAGIGLTSAAPRDPLVACAGLATILGSIGGGVYSIYRLPQWTDRYFLGYEHERNGTQNAICFLSKFFLAGWPVGVWAGEFFAHLDGVADQS